MMPLHSIVSLSDIFCNVYEQRPAAEYRRVGGGLLEIMRYGGEKRVVRLISTDPYMYLDKKYMPYQRFSGE